MAAFDLIHRLRSLSVEEGLPRRGERLVIGLSGGADSVALLDLLVELRRERELHLVAAHLDHGLRPESDADADFCRRLCHRLEVELHVRRRDVAALAREEGGGIEAAGRRARYAFFEELRREHTCDRIATAHHLDDHVETLFLWLGRGTGLAGLRGIEASTAERVRPLRSFRRFELRRHLQERGLDWCEDPSNADPRRRRNRLRAELLPVFEEIFGASVGERLDGFSRRAAEDLRALDALVERARTECGEQEIPGGRMLDRGAFLALPQVLQRQVLERITASRARAGGHQRWNEARLRDVLGRMERARAGEDLSLPGGGLCQVDRDRLSFFESSRAPAPNPLVSWRLVEQLLPPGDRMVTFLQQADAASLTSTKLYAASFDADTVRRPLTLRSLGPGDRIQPAGMKGHKPIRKLLAESSVPRHRRCEQLVVEDGDRIIWAVGLSTAEPNRVRNHTRRVLGLRVEPVSSGLQARQGKDLHS